MSETTDKQESQTTTENVSSSPPVNVDIENLFANTPVGPALLNDEVSDEDYQNLKAGTNVLKSLVITLQKLSRFASRKTGLESVELTDEDVDELTDALEPFAKEILKYIEFLPYLPLIMFAVAYGIRILSEIDEKKQAGKDEAAARVAAAKEKLMEQRQKKVEAQKESEEIVDDKNKTAG